MARRRPTVLVLLALAGAPLLAGCGEDGDAEPGLAAPGSATPPTATAVPIPTVTTPAPTDPEDAPPSVPPAQTLESPDADPPAAPPTVTDVERPAKALRCPAAAGFKGGKAPAGGFDARELLGLGTPAARALARRHGCAVRVVVRDGRELVRTMDFSNARVNVTETDGRVVALNGIG
jgi:pyruvate/2-oxoglutarate dehydrogenase complex dihydrolipoamide acyltransferase (E2) component